MNISPSKRRLAILLLLLSFCFSFLLAPLEVDAAGPVEAAASGLAWIAGTTFSAFAHDALVTVFNWEGKAIAAMAKLLQWAIWMNPTPDIPVITGTWKILRDFANMLFILVLIWMAFATLFNLSKFTFAALIKNFLIVAVLINFSLAIGGIVIDIGQSITTIPLNAIGNVGDRLGQYLNPSQLLVGAPSSSGSIVSFPTYTASLVDKLSSSVISLLFTVVLFGILLFSFTAAAIFAMVRVPILWIMLMISPVAWMSYILPGTRKFWSNWWTEFIAWNIFLPIYLFFVYIGLAFLSKQEEIMAAVAGHQSLTGGLIDSGLSSLTFSLFFFYLFAAWLLLQGLKWARDASLSLSKMAGGNVPGRFGTVIGWGQAGGKAVSGGLYLDNQRKAATEAVKERFGKFQQEGFQNKFLRQVYGGKSGEEQRQARWRERVGLEGAKDAQLSKDVNYWKGQYKNMDREQLRAQAAKTSMPREQRLAAMEVLRDRNELSAAEIQGMHGMYAQSNQLSAEKFANGLDYGKMDADQRTHWFNTAQSTELKKKIQNVRADKGDFRTGDDIWNAAQLYVSSQDQADFIKKAGRRITDLAQLRNIMNRGGSDQQLAVREVLADKGALSNDELLQVYRDFYEDGSQEARDFALKKIKFENLTKQERRMWYPEDTINNEHTINDIEVKRKVAEVMADKGDFGEVGELVDAANLFELKQEKIEFLNKAQKKKFSQALEAKVNLGLVRDRDNQPLTFAQALGQEVKKLKPKDINELPNDLLRDNIEFRNALKDNLDPGKIKGIVNELPQEKIEILQSVFDGVRQDAAQRDLNTKRPIIERSRDRIRALIQTITQERRDRLAADPNNRTPSQAERDAIEEARERMTRLRKIVTQIEDNADLDEASREEVLTNFSQLRAELRTVTA